MTWAQAEAADDGVCCVCLSDMAKPHTVADPTQYLSCFHKFHVYCIGNVAELSAKEIVLCNARNVAASSLTIW